MKVSNISSMHSALFVFAFVFAFFNIVTSAVADNVTVADTVTATDSDSDSQLSSSLMTVSELVAQPSEIVVSVLGGIYEHSPWVVEALLQSLQTISTVSELATRLKSIVNDASDDQKLALLRGYPDLCKLVEIMKQSLSIDSQEEQSRSGLQSLEGEELAKFKTMNESYKTKFGFPFILAVRNASKNMVLSALEGRLENSSSQRELNVALEQVHNIAWMRLLSKVNTDEAAGFLTCHGTYQ